MRYKVAIIGGGPAGYTAAEKSGSAGLPTVLFEKNALGGVCLNEGCIPTKALLYSAKVLDTVRSASKYAVTTGSATFDLSKMQSRKTKVVKKLTAGIRMLMERQNVELVSSEAVISGRTSDGGLQISSGGKFYEADNLIICTGSEAIIPSIPGLSPEVCWTSREALQAKDVPASLLVIGGGVVGMEFASLFNSLGAVVEVIEMQEEILPGFDREMASMLRAEYARRGVKFHLGTKALSADGSSLTVEKDGQRLTLSGEKILLSIGRRPILAGYGLEALQPEMNRGGIKVNEYMQTSVPNVYACGDVTGFSMLAHTAVSEAQTAIRHIQGQTFGGMSYKAVPGIVYTNPEIAFVGMTEEQLQSSGTHYIIKKMPMTVSGRFVAENELSNGLCKLLFSPDGTMLGAHLLGNPSSELIIIAGIAIERGMKAEELSAFVFPHPTVGEIFGL
ncbi:MAG: dihydrolipoyl dehydrogenase [Tannerellaceae bacterium]|jgi:dihydrolipoamide dehydrogenase|nr:dihydrolipoyl dehydrogenase [Tannerellaceae bacterium]